MKVDHVLFLVVIFFTSRASGEPERSYQDSRRAKRTVYTGRLGNFDPEPQFSLESDVYGADNYKDYNIIPAARFAYSPDEAQESVQQESIAQANAAAQYGGSFTHDEYGPVPPGTFGYEADGLNQAKLTAQANSEAHYSGVNTHNEYDPVNHDQYNPAPPGGYNFDETAYGNVLVGAQVDGTQSEGVFQGDGIPLEAAEAPYAEVGQYGAEAQIDAINQVKGVEYDKNPQLAEVSLADSTLQHSHALEDVQFNGGGHFSEGAQFSDGAQIVEGAQFSEGAQFGDGAQFNEGAQVIGSAQENTITPYGAGNEYGPHFTPELVGSNNYIEGVQDGETVPGNFEAPHDEVNHQYYGENLINYPDTSEKQYIEPVPGHLPIPHGGVMQDNNAGSQYLGNEYNGGAQSMLAPKENVIEQYDGSIYSQQPQHIESSEKVTPVQETLPPGHNYGYPIASLPAQHGEVKYSEPGQYGKDALNGVAQANTAVQVNSDAQYLGKPHTSAATHYINKPNGINQYGTQADAFAKVSEGAKYDNLFKGTAQANTVIQADGRAQYNDVQAKNLAYTYSKVLDGNSKFTGNLYSGKTSFVPKALPGGLPTQNDPVSKAKNFKGIITTTHKPGFAIPTRGLNNLSQRNIANKPKDLSWGSTTSPRPGYTANQPKIAPWGLPTSPRPGYTTNQIKTPTWGLSTSPRPGYTANQPKTPTWGTSTSPSPGYTANKPKTPTWGLSTTPQPGHTENKPYATNWALHIPLTGPRHTENVPNTWGLNTLQRPKNPSPNVRLPTSYGPGPHQTAPSSTIFGRGSKPSPTHGGGMKLAYNNQGSKLGRGANGAGVQAGAHKGTGVTAGKVPESRFGHRYPPRAYNLHHPYPMWRGR